MNDVSQNCLKLSKMKSNDLYPCFMMLSCYLVPIDSRLIEIEILKAINLAMVKIVETDERITLEKQLDEDVGPIVVMNKFNVGQQEVDEFLQVFAKTTETFNFFPCNRHTTFLVFVFIRITEFITCSISIIIELITDYLEPSVHGSLRLQYLHSRAFIASSRCILAGPS